MRKGSRVTIEKTGSGFHGMTGTIRLVDRGPSGKTAKAAGIPYRVWYMVKLDDYPPVPDTPVTVDIDDLAEIAPLGFSDEGAVWFRDKEVLPVGN